MILISWERILGSSGGGSMVRSMSGGKCAGGGASVEVAPR